MGRKMSVRIVLTLIISVMLCTTFDVKFVAGWSNGGYGGGYGTHDWIAQHALDWLPDNEKEYILENLDVYLYGTELPDRSPPEGYGDSVLHHIYYWSNGSLQDDASALRAREMYEWAVTYVVDYHNISGAVMCLGIMSHYIVDVGVFGHVMGSGTDWGPETHHEDYETYVQERTNSYDDEFNEYLAFDGDLSNITAYGAARVLAYDTTFGPSGLGCVWMDENYNWNNTNFRNRCGQSLNLCVNLLADVLHTFYEQVIYTRPLALAFIYSTDLDSAQSYKTLLEAHDIAVDLVPNSTAATWDYSGYKLIIIASDTGYLGQWTPESAVPVINESGKPILGLGFGGACFFDKLSLYICWGHGWQGSVNSMYVVDTTHQIFYFPNEITIPPDRIIQLYNYSAEIGIHMPSPVEGVTPLGREPHDLNHYPLIQEDNRYVLWGYHNSPADMTQTGKDLFVNLVLWFLGGTPQGTTRYTWPMFHHDLSHTGYSDSPAPNTNQTLWTYTTGNAVWSSPAVAGGKVYVGSWDDRVYCLDALTGEHVWNYTTGPVASSPAIADDKVYVGGDDRVYCLDALTGEHVWNYTTGPVASSPAVAGGKVYIGSYDHKVYCLDALTGEHVWNYTTGNVIWSSPAVVDGKVYVGSWDDRVYCLDASTGAQIWNYTTGDDVYSSPAVVDGKVYIGSLDCRVYCLDASTGAQIWNYTTGDDVLSSPAVAGGKVYVGSWDNNVYCLNASTGLYIWNYTTNGYVYSSPAVVDGKVYIGSYDHKVYCLDASTGAHIWNYNFTTGNFAVLSSPAIADGMVYVGSCDGKIYAFGNVVRVTENIQEAIDNAPEGAVLIVAVGVYDESLVINKPLTLLGEKGSNPIFNGGGSGVAVTLLSGASGSTIAGIMITNWNQGILIHDASNCKIYDNIMSLMVSNGISVEGASAVNNLIYSNIFQENSVAIDLVASSTTNTIYKNIITSNTVGLSLQSGGNIIYTNTISDNDLGIDVTNSANNVIYHNNFANKIENAIVGAANNVWDDGYPSGGNYWSTYTGIDDKNGLYQNLPGSDGIGDTNYTILGNNIDKYPLMQPFNPHDIGIVNVITKTVVGQGFTLRIDSKILNYGIYDEVFALTAHANTITIATQTITLKTRNSITVTFMWDTTSVAKGNYAIGAFAKPVPGETDTLDNSFTDGLVVITIPGDVNGDKWVNAKDAIALGIAFYPSGTYDPNADINSDGYCNAKDAVILGIHFSEHWE